LGEDLRAQRRPRCFPDYPVPYLHSREGRDEFAHDEDEERRVTWNQMTEAVLMQMQYV
jgi:hypothetical protein